MGGPEENLKMISLRFFKSLISKHTKNLFRGFSKIWFFHFEVFGLNPPHPPIYLYYYDHSDRNIDYETKRLKAIEQKLGYKLIRIYPGK